MPTRKINRTDNQLIAAKIDWLRAAAQEAFQSIDRGEGIEFESMDDLDVYIDQIRKEASAEIAAGRNRR